jgi:hypothetical protein
MYCLDSRPSGSPQTLTVTVPAGKILVVNSWITPRLYTNTSLKLLRNTQLVAERSHTDANIGELYNMVFPTGIAFLAGEDLVIDQTYYQIVSFVYGYEADA